MSRTALRHQAFYVVLGDSITIATTFLCSVALARLLPKDAMGTWQQVLYSVGLLCSLVEFGLSASIYRFWPSLDSSKKAVYAKMLAVLAFCLGGLGSVAILLAIPFLPKLFSNPMLPYAMLAAAAVPLGFIPFQLLRPILISSGRPVVATSIQTAYSLITALALLLPCYFGASLIVGIGYRSVVVLAFSLLAPVVLWRAMREYPLLWSRDLLREVVKYLWPIQVARLPGLLFVYLDKLLMSVLLTPQAFAVYALGAREIPFIGFLGNSMSNVLIPHLVNDVRAENWERIKRRWQMTCVTTAIVSYPVATFCILNADSIMRLLYTEKYTDSAGPFRIFAAFTLVRVIEYGSLAKATGRTDIIMRATVVSGAILAGISLPMALLFGGVGMAVALLIATCISFTYYLWAYSRVVPGRIGELFPFRRLLALAGVAFGSHFLVKSVGSKHIGLFEADGPTMLFVNLAMMFCVGTAIFAVAVFFAKRRAGNRQALSWLTS